VPKRQLTRLFGGLAKDVFGANGLCVIRACTIGRDMRKKNTQVIQHHGPCCVWAIGSEPETKLFQ
jgi:hypothetical protein